MPKSPLVKNRQNKNNAGDIAYYG